MLVTKKQTYWRILHKSSVLMKESYEQRAFLWRYTARGEPLGVQMDFCIKRFTPCGKLYECKLMIFERRLPWNFSSIVIQHKGEINIYWLRDCFRTTIFSCRRNWYRFGTTNPIVMETNKLLSTWLWCYTQTLNIKGSSLLGPSIPTFNYGRSLPCSFGL